LFDQAEAAVKADAELLERVRVARMPLTFARLFPRNGYTIEPGKLVFSGDFAKMPETMDFLDRMQKHGFTTVREMMGEPKQMLLFCTMFNTPMPLATIQNEYLAVDIVPFLAGRALRIVDRKSGECVTAFNTTRNLMFPFAGGEETRIGGTYSTDIVANMVPFVLAEQTPASAVVETYAAAGLCIRRYLALEPDKPVLRIKTVVTNVSEKPREILLRSHLELDLGPLARTAVRFTNRGGEAMAREMKPIIAGLREGEHYYREKTPKSEWTFTGAKGLQVRQTFDDAQVESAWLYAYPDYLNDLEVELWAKPVKVEPKSTASLEHCIEIGPGK
jgi:hypothetical protein